MRRQVSSYRKFLVVSWFSLLLLGSSRMALAELKIYYIPGFGVVPFWERSLWAMDANGGNKKLFLKPPVPISVGPTVSPDGKHLLFTTRSPEDVQRGKIEAKLMVMNFDGSGLQEFLINPPHPFILMGRWSPDGTHVAFTAFNPQQKPFKDELFVADAQGQNFFQIALDLEGNPGAPRWFPDSRRIAFAILKPGGQLHMVDAAPNAKAEPMKIKLFESSQISWSRDGKRTIIAGRTNAGERNELFLGDAMGRNLIQLTRDDEDQSGAQWLPDRRHIVYTTNSEPPMDVAVMNIETKEIRRLTDDGQSAFAFWYDPTLAVNPAGKALTAWGAIKRQTIGDEKR